MKNLLKPKILLTVLMSVLLVLTGCRSLEPVTEESVYSTVMAEMVPSLPEFPKWPEITWVYQNGMYCIPERYADELLDFGENILPLFQWELEQYRKQIEIVLDGIKAVDK